MTDLSKTLEALMELMRAGRIMTSQASADALDDLGYTLPPLVKRAEESEIEKHVRLVICADWIPEELRQMPAEDAKCAMCQKRLIVSAFAPKNGMRVCMTCGIDVAGRGTA